jgi:hypothetical protein
MMTIGFSSPKCVEANFTHELQIYHGFLTMHHSFQTLRCHESSLLHMSVNFVLILV